MQEHSKAAGPARHERQYAPIPPVDSPNWDEDSHSGPLSLSPFPSLRILTRVLATESQALGRLLDARVTEVQLDLRRVSLGS